MRAQSSLAFENCLSGNFFLVKILSHTCENLVEGCFGTIYIITKFQFFLSERNENGAKNPEDQIVGRGSTSSRSFPRRHRQRTGKSSGSSKTMGGHAGLPGAHDLQQSYSQSKHVYESSDSETEATHAQVRKY